MKLRGFIIVGALASIVVGFTLGKIVIADSPVPGSKSDPVVSKSYVEKALQKRVADLENEVAELTAQAQSLQSTINELQAKIDHTSSNSSKSLTPTTSSNQTSSTPENQSTAEKPSTSVKPNQETPKDGMTHTGKDSVVGKTAYINTQNYLNLRSAPTTQASIVREIKKEETLTIQKEENSWYHVKLKDGTVGWVASWLVTVKQ
jgi:uncharacterized protein YgiM (DUF1202 family)